VKRKLYVPILMFLFTGSISAQVIDRPVILAQRSTVDIEIDGVDDDPAWATAAIMSDFTESNPDPMVPSDERTEVKALYSDDGIYVFARMYEDSVIARMTPRDNNRNVDWFAVVLDPYNAGLNGFGLLVTAAGVQLDVRYTPNNEDGSWNAVWLSKTQLTNYGWAVEIFIPYNAIRFPESDIQDWGINFGRYVESTRENSWWAPINPEIDGFLNQAGIWRGLENIESPLRLSLFPFVVGNLNWFHDANANPANITEFNLGGGADLKYGINEAFTLDMTLIPDFSQARSDNVILNLTPFEVQFDEQREFFQEGIELFNRGDIFFTRRIGDQLVFLDDARNSLQEGETLSEIPATARLLNISKITGRTDKGTGLGLLNAISGETYAKKTKADGTTEEVLVSPFTNYNVFVIDQNLKNNSYVSLVNTNVIRASGGSEANVTATEVQLRNKENSLQATTSASLSQLFRDEKVDLGHSISASVAKISGNFNATLNYQEISSTYNINDLGFQQLSNYREIGTFLSYTNFEPENQNFNRWRYLLGIEYASLHQGWDYNNFSLFQNFFYLTKDFVGFGRYTYFEPWGSHDYFEPRTGDFSRYLDNPGIIENGAFISTNYSRTFAIDVEGGYFKFFEPGRYGFTLRVEPRIRVLDNLLLVWSMNMSWNNNDVGFVGISENGRFYDELPDDASFMSRRDVNRVSNILRFDYSISPNLNLNFRMRHQWSTVDVKDVFQLGSKGELVDIAYDGDDINGEPLHDINFNVFNIDMVATWRFAPGSDLIFVWKDAVLSGEDRVRRGYVRNFGRVFEQPSLNTFTLKAVYFLDYFTLKKGITRSS